MKLKPQKINPRDFAITFMFAASVAALPLDHAAIVIGAGGLGAGIAQIINRVLRRQVAR